MDVIVWTESEEREQWWRQVMGLVPASERGPGIAAAELIASGSSRMRVSVRSIHSVTAA